MSKLLKELCVYVLRTPKILCKNIGIKYLNDNPIFQTCMKNVQNSDIQVNLVCSKDQLVDGLTKPLAR